MMKKLLFINGHLKTGGCERSLVHVLQHIDFSKYKVDLLLVEDLGEYLKEVPKDVNVIYYDLKKAFGSFKKTMVKALKSKDGFSIRFRINNFFCSKFGVDKIRHIRKLFKKIDDKYDAIIAYRPGICTDLAAFTFSADKKISWWHHGELNLNEVQVKQTNMSYEMFNQIVAVSDSTAEIVKKHFNEVGDKVKVIPNMIPFNELRKKAEEYKVEPLKEQSIVSVGRFSAEKNMVLCPEIGKRLKESGFSFKWFLIGDGEDYHKTKELVKKYNLENNFVFTGALDNPYPYVKNADLMVHPSLVESQGLSVLESMALGTPVIVVESSGPKEFITDFENGFLVNPNADEIADRIIDVIDNNELVNRVIQKAAETVSEYSPDIIMSKIYNLIEN